MFQYIRLGCAVFLLWSIELASLVRHSSRREINAILGGLLGAAAFLGRFSTLAPLNADAFLRPVDHGPGLIGEGSTLCAPADGASR
jgi:hypothetical protein